MQDRAADNRVAGDTGAENIAAENKRDFERAAEAVDRRRLDWKPVLSGCWFQFCSSIIVTPFVAASIEKQPLLLLECIIRKTSLSMIGPL